MINSLITSQTRIKLLLKFFLNSNTRAHLRGLESEFGESSNGIRVELNRMEEADLLNSTREGNKKLYYANKKHPLFSDIHNIIIKETGIDRVVNKVIDRLGDLNSVYLCGDLAKGCDSNIIDLILIGSGIDREYLTRKVEQAEKLVGRKVRYILLNNDEADDYLLAYPPGDLLPLWNNKKS
ncbi:MAG: ArsR family transcriptional regulator [Bacteroidales bacterium]|nr:ArsR family transcriptional regulator [Bacteroidales bacterium]